MVLEPIHLGKRIGVKIWIKMVLLLVMAVGAIVFMAIKCSPEPKISAASKSDNEIVNYEVNPLPRTIDESPAQVDNRIKDTIIKFLSVTNKSQLNGIIRSPSRCAELIEDFYSRNEFVFPKLKSVDSIEKIEGDLQGFWLVNITVDDLIQARSVILEDTDRGFLMDWEEFVRFGERNWEDFVESKSTEVSYFRVRGSLDENSEFAFSDSVKWLCVRISDWISNEDLYGYVDRESELGIKIKNLLNDEWEKPCILELSFPEDRMGGVNQVQIIELVNENWVLKQKDLIIIN